MLKNAGMNVETTEASDGVEANSILSDINEKFDLIITALVLNKMSGITLLKKIRASKHLAGIPVIVIGTNLTELMEKQLSGCNLAGFVEKPVDHDEFVKLAGGYL